MKKGAYTIRNIPPDLWAETKALAQARGMTIRGMIFQALREYIKNHKKGEL